MSSRPERPCALIARLLAAASLALVVTGPANALPDDRNQPILIEADEAVRDEKQGFTRYVGNVTMDQGSLHIEAERITVYHDAKDADRILAEGAPAHMQQQPEPEKGLIKAYANIIEYHKAEDRVQLRENASIEQEGSTVTGDSIDYFITEQLVRADSDKSREDSRVQVVIEAAALDQEEEASGDTESE
ncbi:lipopolysaccharide transport periplasmic protein LptA [Halioglobus maricola]|nr:lipopolysaccharide transport periplasmic protein LptA [Halioglobus maricola]